MKTVADVRLVGVVAAYVLGRGFGFVKTDGRARDVFVHFSDVIPAGDLAVGDTVAYEIEERDGRVRAVRVRRTG